MNKLLQFFYLQCKVILRVPIALFFSVVFPVLLLVMLIMTNGNPIIYYNVHFVDVYIPSLALLTLLPTGLVSFSIDVSVNRSKKIWQTYTLKGLNLYHIIFSQFLAYILLAFISTLLAILVAKLFYGLIFPSFNDFLMFCLVWFLSAVVVFLIGFSIGCFLNNEKSTQQTSTMLMFLLMFLSGIFTNIHSFPLYVQNIVQYLPTTQIYYILSDYWLVNNIFKV
ncbi:MAG: ABC transporter permease [Methanobrevibacter sp.]|jgi:ABC-2 type transport system permease protein|nr:ABC transporter permease [Candidatus Methanovirga aequatorialis]